MIKQLFKDEEPKKTVKRRFSLAWVKPMFVGLFIGAVVTALVVNF